MAPPPPGAADHPGEDPGPGPAVPPEGSVRWRLSIAYDGAAFRGFAHQPGQTTVAGELAAALARSLRLPAPPALTCAGRTDAGVHARHQVVHVDLPEAAAASWGSNLAHALTRQLGPRVVVRTAEPAPPGFDARRSARWRAYRYLVWNAPAPDPLLAPVAWHVADPLDRRALAAGADTLIGEHDFRSFCRRPPGTGRDQPIVRRVEEAGWLVDPGPDPGHGVLLRFEIRASSFCHQMVRSLAAALVEVGRHRLTPADLVALLRAQDRQGAPQPAPPHGLCLVAVGYPEPG